MHDGILLDSTTSHRSYRSGREDQKYPHPPQAVQGAVILALIVRFVGSRILKIGV